MNCFLLHRQITHKVSMCHCKYKTTVSSKHLRKSFISFFENHGHQIVRSSPVLPHSDPSLSFVNAGMTQFKRIFLGATPAPCPRAVNSQKCIRVSGKHGDLEAVGKDGTHHTFFEMLGSWSFGDYFKKDACTMAWKLLTEEYGLDHKRMYVTYFGGDPKLKVQPDLETKEIWQEIGVKHTHIIPFNSEHNFWEMGVVGPCGPCTEIHYDHCGTGNISDLVELWNLVFMQFERRENGDLTQLPTHHVDTGMGLERLTAVCSNVISNYDTDIFQPIFSAIQKESKCLPYRGRFGCEDEGSQDTGYRILADHIRMATVSLADGVYPETNYRLQHIIRKALRVIERNFNSHVSLPNLADVVIEQLGDVYPELHQNHARVKLILGHESELWTQSQKKASQQWHQIMMEYPNLSTLGVMETSGTLAAVETLQKNKTITGNDAYFLYNTHGVGIELLSDIAAVLGAKVDVSGFQDCVHKQSMQSKWATSAVMTTSLDLVRQLREVDICITNDDYKYEYKETDGDYLCPDVDATLKTLIIHGKVQQIVHAPCDCTVITDRTNFYATSGGQVGDTGTITNAESNAHFNVLQTESHDGYVFHIGRLTSGTLQLNQKLNLSVSPAHRSPCMKNHTATHLVQAALSKEFPFVCQKSSLVTPYELRFDFSTYGVDLSDKNVEQVQNTVCQWIREEIPVIRTLKSINEAITEEVVTVPGEFYPEEVVLVQIGDVSKELCCGTHVTNTKDIADFVITGVRSNSSVKSVSGATGMEALEAIQRGTEILDLVHQLEQNTYEATKLHNEIKDLQAKISVGPPIPWSVKNAASAKLYELHNKLQSHLQEKLGILLRTEIQNARKRAKDDFVTCFLRIALPVNKVPLLKATRLIKDKPVMVVAMNGDVVTARCCVPQASSHFNAQKWMQVLMSYLNAEGGPPKGQDPLLVYNMKAKKATEKEVAKALQKAYEMARLQLLF